MNQSASDTSPCRLILAAAILLPVLAAAIPAVGAEPLRIMCVGDSITAGYTDNPHWNVPFEFGYRAELYTRLTEAGYAVQFVGASPEPWNGAFGKPRNTPSPDLRPLGQDRHRGYGGWGTDGILKNIEGWLAEDKPDVVLLMIGINDGGSVHARNNLEKIVQTIVAKAPAADVIVAQITPTASPNQALVDYNTYIRETLVPACRAKAQRVSTVDQYRNLLTGGKIDAKLFSNGINHPDRVAYGRMAATWFEGIAAVRPLPAGKTNKGPQRVLAPGAPAERGKGVAIVQQWTGAYSARQAAGRLVIEDQKAWDAAWADMTGNISPRPETPKIDFARQKVVAVFMGTRNTGGYSIRITRIETAAKVFVYVKESSPPPDAMTTQALTSPYHAVLIPKIDAPVEFVND